MEWKNLDAAMTYSAIANPESLSWYDAKEAPFGVFGLSRFRQEREFARFSKAEREALQSVSPAVAELSTHLAGGQIRFITDSASVSVAARLTHASGMDHFAATGEAGIDCYVMEDRYRFKGVTRFDRTKDNYAVTLASGLSREKKEVILNLPLYAGLVSLHIGLDAGATLLPPKPFAHEKPIVIYGSSITQGGCATRPGMLHTNILSRRMDREFINFGFSGSGKGEKEVAELVAKVETPGLYILSYEPNAGMGVKTTMDSFLAVLRKAHPVVPILVVSRLPFEGDNAMMDELRAWQADCVRRHRDAGDSHISFLDGRRLMPKDADECFVDTVHPTDLGFAQIADNLQPVIEPLL